MVNAGLNITDFGIKPTGGRDTSLDTSEVSPTDFASVLSSKFERADQKSISKEPTKLLPEVPAEEVPPMQEFLKSIEKEANVKPEQWVNAMLKISPEEQLENPWETADKIISTLNIAPENKDKVLSSYETLLSKLQDCESKPLEEPIAREKGDHIDSESLISAMTALTILGKEIDKSLINEKQAMATKQAVDVQPTEVNFKAPAQQKFQQEKLMDTKLVVQESGGDVMVPTSLQSDQFKKEIKPFTNYKNIAAPTDSRGELDISNLKPIKEKEIGVLPVIKEKNELPNGVSKLVPKADTLDLMNNMVAENSELLPIEEGFAKDAEKMDFLLESDVADNEAALSSIISENKNTAVVQKTKNVLPQQYQIESKQENAKAKTKFSNTMESEVKSSTEDLSSQDFFIDTMPLRSTEAQSVANKGHLAPTSLFAEKLLNQGDDVNSKEVIRNAQIMIRNGGGEIKVKLNPESLGEVNMKMIVSGDKVHLALDTSNIEAKKAIERTIDDLRINLSANKLHLETVKVDVSNQADNQFSNHRFDQGASGREQARQFLHNFREDNGSRRHNIVDRVETGKTAPSSVGSRAASVHAARGRYGVNGFESGRLNLVA